MMSTAVTIYGRREKHSRSSCIKNKQSERRINDNKSMVVSLTDDIPTCLCFKRLICVESAYQKSTSKRTLLHSSI